MKRIASWEYHPETEMPIAFCTADADILTATTDEDENAFIDISLADTRRIQAAWNAVEAAGISTTALERGVIGDLLESCKALLAYLRDDNPGGFCGGDAYMTGIAEKAAAAIAKAEPEPPAKCEACFRRHDPPCAPLPSDEGHGD